MRRHLGHGLLLATLLVLTACGGSDDASSGTGTSTDPSTDVSTAASTNGDGSGVTAPDSGAIDGSSTTVKGSTGTTVAGSTGTTVAPTQSTNAIPQTTDDLVLRSDGLGPLRFGVNVDTVVASISAVLGTPTTDAAAAYPLPAGDGTFKSQDSDGVDDLGFVKPFGRTVCWADGLCIESSGTTAGPYTFVGWYYAAADADSLATADGLDVGSRWADFTSVMTAEPGGCYSVGYGTSAGISLTLQSSGTPFSIVTPDGTETPNLPAPDDVTVVQMQAGDQVAFLQGDC